MLTCHACMRRYVQTLIGDSASVYTWPRTALSSNPSRSNHKRNFTIRRAPVDSYTPDAPAASYTPDAPTVPWRGPEGRKARESTSFNRQRWLESRGQTPLHKQKEKATDDSLFRRQLKHLKDPLKLADYVRTTLREDDFESALAIVRAASKDTQCIVSWNHLIDWQLSKGRMNDAIKTYNEMKKRAQTPDAYTFTIIFRGCAEHPLPAQALAKVITIYSAMLTDRSPVKPNTIHMNAVLKMCARADDMDALFAIADDLPNKGPRSPNNLTYTIILNAIRMHAFNSLRGNLTEVQKRKLRQEANLDARRIWKHASKRWGQGDIMIDEALICTMGRVLLLGVDRDIDDVLSLVEQTMNIPRQAPSLRSRSHQEVYHSPTAEDELGVAAELDPAQQELNPLPTVQDDLSLAVTDPFAVTSKSAGLYAKPGQNTLSLLMEALLDLRLKEPATKYWNILTDEYAVEPDANNYHAYLRVLRIARASTETVKILLKMPQSDMGAKTFRIAMSTCGRDKNNKHAFANAGKILDIMQTACKIPDPQVVSEYLHVAFSVNAYSQNGSSNGEPAATKYEKGKQIMRALERISPSYINLRSLLSYGDPTKPAATNDQKALFKASVLELTQNLIRAHDLLMANQMVDREKYLSLIKERSKLAAFITRQKSHPKTFSRPEVTKRVAEDIKIPKYTDPSFQSRKAAARKIGPEAYEPFRNEFAAEISENADTEVRGIRAKHEEKIRGDFAEKFAEQEGQAAEAALLN